MTHGLESPLKRRIRDSVAKARMLTRYLQEAFHLREMRAARPSSKRHPVGDDETGPEAAQKYRLRHPLAAGRASSIKKLYRAARIAAGERPLKYGVPGKRERTIAAKIAHTKRG